ncbi:MAG: hypothetical protein K6A94_01760 [Bacteroidales bacterium]|nr:hypothetical protein [Bacteroidales bacterium]
MNNIEINGKQYPCRITMGAMLRFKQETDKDVSQMKPDDMGDLVTLLWCCVASASKAEGVEFGMSPMDFADSLDPETVTGFFVSMEGEGKAVPEKKTK